MCSAQDMSFVWNDWTFCTFCDRLHCGSSCRHLLHFNLTSKAINNSIQWLHTDIYIYYIHMYIGDVWLYNHGYIIILWTGLRASTVSNSLNKYFKQGLLASWRLKRFACEATQLGVLSKEAASTSFWSHQWLHLKIIQWDPEFPWFTIAALWPWHYHLVNTQKITKSYWTWPFIVDLPIKNGDSP